MNRKAVGKTILSVFVVVSIFLGSINSYAGIRIADAKNTKCPVTGESIQKRKYNTQYKGKKYWFSSYNAVKEFKSNPAKYSRNLS